MTTMLRHFVLISLLACFSFGSAAEQFIFTSDRPVAKEDTGQFDVYLYDSGEITNLTETPDASEYDPQPSPSGRYLAFFSRDEKGTRQHDGWTLRIMDLEILAIVSEGTVPGLSATNRPAGGFKLAWLPGEETLLIQGVAPDFNWTVYHYEVGSAEASFLVTGYDVLLSPDASRFATAYEDWVWIFDRESLKAELLVPGDPLAWTAAGIIVGTSDALQVISPDGSLVQELLAGAGYYMTYTLNPATGVQAVTRSTERGHELLFIDADGKLSAKVLLPGLTENPSWLDEDTLLLSVTREDFTSRIMRYSLASNTLTEALRVEESWTELGARSVNPHQSVR